MSVRKFFHRTRMFIVLTPDKFRWKLCIFTIYRPVGWQKSACIIANLNYRYFGIRSGIWYLVGYFEICR